MPSILAEDGFDQVSSSSVPLEYMKDHPPRPLSIKEIEEYPQIYAQAAENAIKAGFDGIELHSANGYLINQFLHETVNNRTDEYGGSIENRARFALEIIEACVKAIGASKVGIRFSPWEFFNGL